MRMRRAQSYSRPLLPRVSVDDDVNAPESEDERSIVSQDRFQTQAPFTQPRNEQDALNRPQIPPKPLSSAAQRSDREQMLNLLGPKPAQSRSSQTRQRSALDEVFVDDQVPPRGAATEYLEGDASTEPIASSLLSQQPLQQPRPLSRNASMPPPNSIPSKKSAPASQILKDIAPTHENVVAEPVQPVGVHSPSMPASLQRRFQRWRDESMTNRYLPRRITRISKTQSVLLDSDDSYYPPLAGRDQRPGTVPLKLLNSLTFHAGQVAFAPNEQQEAEANTAKLDRQTADTVPDAEDDENIDSIDSSQSVPWSPTPEPVDVRVAMPPDSPRGSAAGEVEDEAEIASIDEPVMLEAGNPTLSANNESSPAGSQASPRPDLSDLDEEEIQTTLTNDHQKKARFPPSTKNQLTELLCTARQPDKSVLDNIQVKRTPFPGMSLALARPAAFNSGSPQDQTESGNERIFSTYDDVALRQLPVLNIRRQPSHTRLSALPNSEATTQPAKGLTATKRRASDGLAGRDGTKRTKVVSRGRHPDKVDPDYAQVLENSRARRSEELSRLNKEQDQQQRRNSSSTASYISPAQLQRKPDLASVEALRRTSKSDLAPTASTPITIPSDIESRAASAVRVAKSSSRTTSARPIIEEIYQRYKQAYSDYAGNLKSFDNACNLVRRFRIASKRPHPSLFDDFVFHHYHSYRQYLQQVAESSDDPLAYADFYDEFVDSPKHKLKILTNEALGLPSPKTSTLRRESSNFEANTTHSNDGSVAPNSSASNRPTNHATPAQVPLRDEKEGKETLTADNDAEGIAMDLSQQSSVKSWIDNLRAGSPELGTPDIHRSQDMEAQDDKSPAPVPKPIPSASAAEPSSTPHPVVSARAPVTISKRKSRPSTSPFVSGIKQPTKKWWKDDNTPFKAFAAQFNQVHSVRIENAASTAKRKSIDIFTWRS